MGANAVSFDWPTQNVRKPYKIKRQMRHVDRGRKKNIRNALQHRTEPRILNV